MFTSFFNTIHSVVREGKFEPPLCKSFRRIWSTSFITDPELRLMTATPFIGGAISGKGFYKCEYDATNSPLDLPDTRGATAKYGFSTRYKNMKQGAIYTLHCSAHEHGATCIWCREAVSGTLRLVLPDSWIRNTSVRTTEDLPGVCK